MRQFYRVQWKGAGRRTWKDTTFGGNDPDLQQVELTYKQAVAGKKDAITQAMGKPYSGKFRIVKITQTIEVVH